jgi:hypothetical protein
MILKINLEQDVYDDLKTREDDVIFRIKDKGARIFGQRIKDLCRFILYSSRRAAAMALRRFVMTWGQAPMTNDAKQMAND